MFGILKKDIYEATDRFPIDSGECYTKEEISEMFELRYPKGTRFYRQNDGECFAWYLKNGDGGWAEFHPLEDYFNGKREHNIISNLEIKGISC